MGKLTLDLYKKLCRKVIPSLPASFDSMQDDADTYRLILDSLPPVSPTASVWDRHDHHSVKHWAETKLREIDEHDPRR